MNQQYFQQSNKQSEQLHHKVASNSSLSLVSTRSSIVCRLHIHPARRSTTQLAVATATTVRLVMGHLSNGCK